jgi:hypothetical protein
MMLAARGGDDRQEALLSCPRLLEVVARQPAFADQRIEHRDGIWLDAYDYPRMELSARP